MSSAAPSRETPRQVRRNASAMFGWLWGFVGFALILLIWYLAVAIGQISPLLLPSPISVLGAIVDRPALFLKHAGVTLQEIMMGFSAAAILGIALGIALAFSSILARIVYPVLVIGNAVPKVALAPLLLVWVGFGPSTSAFLAMLVAIFPMVINTSLGLSSINEDFVRLGHVMGGTRSRVFWKIRLPTALPSIFAGLKVAITLATIGAIVGELIAGQAGLGYLSQYMAGQLEMAVTFASIVVLATMGVILFYLVVLIEFWLIPWRRA